MQDGLLPISRKGEHISVVDKEGSTVFLLDKIDNLAVKSCASYSNGIMHVELADNTVAYVDTEGQMLFGRRFAEGLPFRNGFAIVRELQEDSQEADDEKLYTIIDTSGKPVFVHEDGFEIDDDMDGGGFSFSSQLIASVKKKKFYIYQFDGSLKCKCPAKVKMVNYVCDNYYVFSNDDDEMGVMDYNGEQLIRPHYEQLIPIGNLFLAQKESDDDEIRLIDIKDTQIKTMDGEEIVRAENMLFDFPLVVETEDDEMYLLDNKGNKLNKKSVSNIEDDFEDIGSVSSNFFDSENVLNTMLRITGNGTGVPLDSAAYFKRNGVHCHTYNVPFLKNIKLQDYKNKKNASYRCSTENDYFVNFDVTFDEVIAREYDGVLSLSSTAWLTQLGFTTRFYQPFVSERVIKELSSKLCDYGCSVEYKKSKNLDSFVLLRSNDNNYAILLQSSMYYLYCTIEGDPNKALEKWKNEVDEFVSKK